LCDAGLTLVGVLPTASCGFACWHSTSRRRALVEAKETSFLVLGVRQIARYHALLVAAMKIGRFFSRRLTIVLLAAAGLVGWLGRESLLGEAADLWIVSDPLTHADAIVVLGGNSQTRPPVAADLYRRGLANKVLVSNSSDFQLNRAALLKLGVPASAIEAFGRANTNTREEAVALREWAERNAASVFVIPSEPFMTRRVQWIFRRELFAMPVTIKVQPLESPGYSPEGWWKTEQGSIAFQNEISKYLYYRWKY
jgi:uncharacterized SAM-binding protein YcdF (DUF218 family)